MTNLYRSTEYYQVVGYSSRKEWLESRIGCIGASDASCVLGLNPYKTKEQFIEDKITNNIKLSQKGAMKYGQENESLIRELFKIDYRTKYEVDYTENVNVFSVQYPFLSCSPDSLLLEIGRKMNGRKGILEIKTAYIKNDDELSQWNHNLPMSYYIQVLHQLLVMSDMEFIVLRAKLKIYDRKTKEYNYWIKDYHIERKDVKADIDYLFKKEIEFILEHRDIDFKAITDEFAIDLAKILGNE